MSIAIDLSAALLLGALGSLVTFLVGFFARGWGQRRLARKYPVAGEFLTEYDDIDDGVTVRRKAHSVLRQKGRAVTGTTMDLGTRRAWKLQGTLNPSGFIFGFYDADDPHDNGSGTFFLEVDRHLGDLHGLWSGYDSANRKVSSGRYLFHRRLEVAVREARPADAHQIVALMGEALGERYIEVEDILRSISSPDRVCFVALSQGLIVGAATASVLDGEDLAGEFPPDKRSEVRRLSFLRYHARLMHLEANAVSPEYRGRGVGTQLVERRLEWGAELGVAAAISFGWKSPDGCAVGGVLEAEGFVSYGEVDNFWTESVREGEYTCPACDGLCHCSAVVYARTHASAPPAPSVTGDAPSRRRSRTLRD